MKADNSGGGLGGRFQFSFAKPQKISTYGRHDLDAVLVGAQRSIVNRTQKSIDEARLLVRLLSPRGGLVVSVCNGTGTTMVAALLEGRHCVGVDDDEHQNTVCRERLATFFVYERLLDLALKEHRNPACSAVQ